MTPAPPLTPRSGAGRAPPAAAAAAALVALAAAATSPLADRPLAAWRIKVGLAEGAAHAPAKAALTRAEDIENALAAALAVHPRLRASGALYQAALLRPTVARAIYDPKRLSQLSDHEAIVAALDLAETLLAEPPAENPARPAAGPSPLPALVAAAADRTGVDARFLMRTALWESAFNPYAIADGSSARGLFQFVEQTWLLSVARWGPRHGLAREAAAIQILPSGRARVADPAAERAILQLRYDPELSARMAAEFAAENDLRLTHALGRRPSAGELYAAHLLGLGGAVRLIRAAYLRPDQPAAALLPAAAATNPRLFYRRGSPRSVSELLLLLS